jgi:serine/threonine protein kinase
VRSISHQLIVLTESFQNNIVIDEKLTAKLCGFGLAGLIPRDGSKTDTTTRTPHCGTARYLSYELVMSNESPTTASDVHALGCVGFAVRHLS